MVAYLKSLLYTVIILVVKSFIYFLKDFYLFIFRERGVEGEREGEKHQCVVVPPYPGPGLQPRHMP